MGTVGGAPVMVHNPYNPHMNPLPHAYGLQSDLQRPERAQETDSSSSAPFDYARGDHFVEPAVDERPTSSYPRFSMATSDGSGGDRDSMTSDRDSSILSGFAVGQPSVVLPPLQESGRSPQQEFGFGRESVQAIIGHASDRDSLLSQGSSRTLVQDHTAGRELPKPAMEHVVEEDTSPTREARIFSPVASVAAASTAITMAPKTSVFPPSPMDFPKGSGGSTRRKADNEGVGGHSRSKSQPPLRQQRQQPGASVEGRGRKGEQDSRPPNQDPRDRYKRPDQRRLTPSPSRQQSHNGYRGPPGERRVSPSPNRSRSERNPRERGPPMGGVVPLPSEEAFRNDSDRSRPPGPTSPGYAPGSRRARQPRQIAIGDQDGQQQRRPPIGSGDERSPIDSPGYVPFSYKKSPTTPTSAGFGPPSRQSSAESGVFPPPSRVGSGNSERLQPYRKGSGDAKYVPYRQGSGDGDTKAWPQRRDSADSDRGRVATRTSPSPQQPNSILPMLASIRAISPEAVDRDNSNFGQMSATRMERSSSAGLASLPERSPSAASDAPSAYSIGGTRQARPSFNFSRPLSNRPSIDTERPYIDLPSPSSDGPRQFDALPTPVSFTDEPAEYNSDGPAAAVIYSRFILPRGREPNRGDSVVFHDSFQVPTQDPGREPGRGISRARTPANLRPPSPARSPPNGSTQPKSPVSPRPPFLTADSRQPSPNRSAQPRSPRLAATAPNKTPDEHLHLGLDLHEKGKSAESTYHFRLAAHGGHPTGMLFYALACRHGWGMRPNQKEGVMWLKKVTQLASSQVVDDENGITNVAFIEKQGRRAQFALSIYELGVSHLNGWGTEMDKGLALNCFEIAGSE